MQPKHAQFFKCWAVLQSTPSHLPNCSFCHDVIALGFKMKGNFPNHPYTVIQLGQEEDLVD